MVRNFFPLFFIFQFVMVMLWLCSALCEVGYASSNDAEKWVVNSELFKPGDISQNVQNEKGEAITESIHLKEIKLPFLYFVASKKNAIIAVAEGKYTKNGGSEKVDVLTKYFKTEKDKVDEDDIGKMKIDWKTQLATENKKEEKTFSTVIASVVDANKDKIYTFLLNITDKDKNNWDFKLVVGAVDGQDENNSPITWSTENLSESDSVDKIKQKLNKKTSGLETIAGYAFLTKNNKILFVLTGKSANKEKKITVFFLFEKIDGNKIKLLSDENSVDCYSSFFQLGKEIFETPIDDSNDGCKKIMMFNAEQKVFEDSSSPITHLQTFFKDKTNFATAKVGTKEVLFFTQEKSNGSDSNGKKDVNLWMTDGTRVGYVGPIIIGFKTISYGPVLYINDEFFALHQKYNNGDKGNGAKVDNTFSLTRLTAQLEQVKFFLKQWEQINNTVLELCKDTDKQNIYCTAPPPTDGLVGFLHNTINESTDPITWKDEFYYSNATVKKGNAQKATNGFKFTGKGAGAKWPVGKQNEKPVYSFTDFGFALLATVKIEKTDSTSDNSLLGIGLSGEPKQVGLWCKREKWVLRVQENNLEETEKKCEPEKEYNVAFVLEKDKAIKIYVNGDHLAGLSGKEKHIKDKDKITHFYFGVDPEGNGNNNDESHVTVTNVLLYNKPFNDEEIIKLKKYVKSVEETQTTKKIGDKNTDGNTGGSNDQQTPPTLPSSPTGDEKKGPSPSRTEDGGVGGGVRVFSLLLAVLCVSALLLHL